MCFINIIRRNFTIRYDIQSCIHSSISCGILVAQNKFVSGCDCGLLHVDGKTGL